MSLYILLALDDKSHGASFYFSFERCFIATHERADTSREVPLNAPFIARDRIHWSGLANSKNYLILYARCTAVYAIHKCSMFIFSLSILHASCTSITVARASFQSILSSRVIHITVLIPGRSTSSFNLEYSPWDIRMRESSFSNLILLL